MSEENHKTVFNHEKRITKQEVLGDSRAESRAIANALIISRLDDLTDRLNNLVAERYSNRITRGDIEAIIEETQVNDIKIVTAGSELTVKQLLAIATGLVTLAGSLAGTVAYLALKLFGA